MPRSTGIFFLGSLQIFFQKLIAYVFMTLRLRMRGSKCTESYTTLRISCVENRSSNTWYSKCRIGLWLPRKNMPVLHGMKLTLHNTAHVIRPPLVTLEWKWTENELYYFGEAVILLRTISLEWTSEQGFLCRNINTRGLKLPSFLPTRRVLADLAIPSKNHSNKRSE